jgi:hypothetical protein
MERRYHFSPQAHLQAGRFSRRLGYAARSDLTARLAPLPPELAAVAPDIGLRRNWFTRPTAATVLGTDPRRGRPWAAYAAIGDRLGKPYSAVDDPMHTWLDIIDHAFDRMHRGHVVFTGGFYRSAYFLQEPGRPRLADYVGHPSYVDDVRAFTSPITGVALFEPA